MNKSWKKTAMVLGFVGASVFGLSACSEDSNKEDIVPLEKEEQVKINKDEKNEVPTLLLVEEKFNNEYMDVHYTIDNMIKNNPDLGTNGEHELMLVNIAYDPDVPSRNFALILSVNRTDEVLKDYSFDLTIGVDDEYVFNKEKITIDSETYDVINPNEILPILIPIDEEDLELTAKMYPVNTVFKAENIEYN